ncbi:MAG TPA: DUF58 domain-containing protein [Blastocatellia bacterium]|nr:DUF58 domain-containing protein [Blastocatellia bacterium]
MSRQAWRDFFITVIILGISFVLALFSSVAAERYQAKLAALAAAVSLILALLGAIYIIPRLARNVRLEMLRFALRTTVTLEGLLFVVFLMVVTFAAWNSGNNLLYLVLSAMIAFLIAANLIARVALADVSVQLRFPDHIYAGEPAMLAVTLLNHKRVMPSYSLMVEALPEAGDEDEEGDGEKRRHGDTAKETGLGKLAYFALAPARSSVRRRVERKFARRGRYPITGFRVSTRFPAGFFKKWRSIDASGELLVYPNPQPLDDFYHALPMLAGMVASQTRGSGDDLYGIRRYHPSDHMRHIDWKATAKSMQMMVREYMREDEWRLTIVFDTAYPEFDTGSDGEREYADGFENKFERAVVMAASLANHFVMERAEVEFVTATAEHTVASGSGYEHLYKILRSLATLRPAYRTGREKKPGTEGRGLWGVFGRSSKRQPEKTGGESAPPPAGAKRIEWRLLDDVPVLADERRFKVLITSAAKGTIPATVWRSAHVVFIEDL